MAEKILSTRIQLKYDSYEKWTSEAGAAVVLKAGEVGICAIPSGSSAVNGDNTRPQILFKVGDGTSAFSALPWASAKAADVYDWAKQANLPVTKEGTGNVVASIAWDEATKGIKFTTASVATSEGLEDVQTNLTNLTTKVNAMYTNEQIDTAVADAKKAGTDAAAALEAYKTTNDAAVALKADQTALDAVSAVANAAATQTALQEEIDRAKAAEKVNADAIERLTKGVSQEEIDSVNDLIEYVNTHGPEVTQMKADIAANTKAISDEATRADTEEKRLAGLISANAEDIQENAAAIAKIANGETVVTNAENATKATQDAAGNVIVDTYETKSDAAAKLAEAKKHADDLIAGLDVEDAAVAGQYVSAVSEADGKITVTRADLPTLTGGAEATADASIVSGVTVSGHEVTVAKKTITTTANNGLKVTGSADTVNIDIDSNVVFVLDGGSATRLVD